MVMEVTPGFKSDNVDDECTVHSFTGSVHMLI